MRTGLRLTGEAMHPGSQGFFCRPRVPATFRKPQWPPCPAFELGFCDLGKFSFSSVLTHVAQSRQSASKAPEESAQNSSVNSAVTLVLAKDTFRLPRAAMLGILGVRQRLCWPPALHGQCAPNPRSSGPACQALMLLGHHSETPSVRRPAGQRNWGTAGCTGSLSLWMDSKWAPTPTHEGHFLFLISE